MLKRFVQIVSIYLVFICIAFGSFNSQAQVYDEDAKGLMLLNDINAQIASSDMIDNIYNFKLQACDSQYVVLKEKYGWHPLPYYLRALAEWWLIEPETENITYDSTFLAYIDTAKVHAESIYNIERTKLEGAFFLSATHALTGRLYGERKQWRKAAFEAKKSLSYLNECRAEAELSPELLFGDGLYNYFSVWLPENYGMLKPVMLFFDSGDKELGIEQLRDVCQNAFFTRTEAQYFLMRILNMEGNKRAEALQLAQYLHETYPDNPAFERYYARLLYSSGKTTRMKKVSEDILRKISEGKEGFGPNSGRYAAFFLGNYYDTRLDYENAKHYYNEVRKFVNQNGYLSSGYHLHSLLGMLKIAVKEDDQKQAKELHKLIRKNAKRKHYVYKQAKKIMRAYM
ncbi:tol-pal system protein YbgF [Aureibacter tunicatorum]|uniref:Tol-pal system protein YbgF n=1 Tax=Aureibacter tunicatorum TaxID=866807 RepID=A0AAE3XQK4_9BACT|nr:tol-pal system protein YbgF [Aureibacter tunicatorum]MDR6240248.1 hypothetical protein [Aureibacter tunicatorum]BDD05871.1 hypothetical protein AUTU_33540 [Aureibacter tunicatorum]